MVEVKNIFEISDSTYHYAAGYYTTNKWLDNDTIVIARSECPEMFSYSAPVELVKVCLSTKEITLLCSDAAGHECFGVHGKNVYYTDGKRLILLDSFSGEKLVLLDLSSTADGKDYRLTMPDITSDGKYISVLYQRKDMPSIFYLVDSKNGNIRYSFEKEFARPFDLANHGMVCPTNPDVMFFAHEGQTRYVSNRLWIYNAKNNDMYNLAKQHLDENGILGDCFGHEMWAPHGKGMYFVKYPCSPVPPRGICYVDLETRKTEILYSSYPYWHVGVSHNNRYLLSDTQTNDIDSKVVVIDREDNTETVIDEVKVKVHPAHPHPQMSPDNKKVIYTTIDHEGRIYIKCAVLE